jgi:hypothetical protein
MKIIRPPLFMRPNPESDLEQAIDRELRGLPELRAPEDLLPRVLELAMERGRRPWWQKSFVHWPWMARCLFLAMTTALCGLAVYFTWGVSIGLPFESLSGEVALFTERFSAVRSIAGSLGGALVALGALDRRGNRGDVVSDNPGTRHVLLPARVVADLKRRRG